MSASVVILEDDATMANAIATYLKKRNIEAMVTARVEEARSWLSANRVKLMIIDCLLPSESGVDFAIGLRKNYPAGVLDVILMSGIFVEPNFIKDSLRSTQALAFLKKPFELAELDSYLQAFVAAPERFSPKKALYGTFAATNASSREKRKIIESLEEIHGYDLPFIYSFLQHSKISGHLNIADAKGQVFGITFSSGALVGVDLADSETFLGKLLIESGYILPDDLEQVVNSQSSKRIGERLIQGQLLSPHGFEQVLSSQMSIRLSRTILAESVRVNFVASDVEMTKPRVEPEMLQKFIHDWVAAKIDEDWLRAHFTPWGTSTIIKGPEFRVGHPAFLHPLVASLENFVINVLNETTLNDLLEKKMFPEENFLKALHFLMCAGIIVLQDKPQVRTPGEQQKHLKNVQHQFHGKNPVEIYELMVRMTTASENNPSQVFNEFVLLLGQMPADKSLALLYKDVHRLAEGAFEAVKSGSHLKLKDELMRHEVEKKLKASSVFDQAKTCLEKSQFSQALILLEKVIKLDPKFDKIHLYLVWARLGAIENVPNKAQAFKSIDNDLMLIAPEDKFDALYTFLMGLYHKAKGDTTQARKTLERAIAMDGSLIVARRELAVLTSANKQKQDVFNQDLKTLVGSLFSRKK